MRICPNCGTRNPEDARFCTGCGTSPQAAGEERRLVTALFAGIADVQRRLEPGADPEDFTAALRPFHELLQRDVEGSAAPSKVAGDIVFGVFGVPVTHEDDAERAVRAALRIRDEVQRQRRRTVTPVRVGIATGEVIVSLGKGPRIGERVTGDVGIRPRACRPQRSPTASSSGNRLPRHAVQLPLAGPASGHGQGQGRPDRDLDADRASRPGGGGTPDPAGAPFVGRHEELRILRTEFLSSMRDHRPRLVTIVGDAGLGKSRLIAELSVATDELPELVRWRVGRPPVRRHDGVRAVRGDRQAGTGTSLVVPEVVASKLDSTLRRVWADGDEAERLRRHSCR